MSMISSFPGSFAPAGASEPLPAGARLVDVRSRSEFAAGHIEGALNLPLERFNSDLQQVVPDKLTPVILYCRSGARSGHAHALMRQLGYQEVHNGGSVGSLARLLKRVICQRA